MRNKTWTVGEGLLMVFIMFMIGLALGAIVRTARAQEAPMFDTERKVNVIWWNTGEPMTPKIRMYVIRNDRQQEFLLACETGTGCSMVEVKAP